MQGDALEPTSAIAGPTPALTRRRGCPECAPETISDVSVLATLAAALMLEAAAPALPEGLDVQWTGVLGCPSEADVVTRIAERFYEREDPVRASIVIAVVSDSDGAYRLTLEVAVADEIVHRELESDDCEVLVEATAVVAGIAVEPERSVEVLRTVALIDEADAVVPKAPPPSSVEAVATPDPIPMAGPKPPSAVQPDPRRPGYSLAGAVRLHGGVGGGVVPGVSGSAGLRLGLLGPRWRVEGGADRTFETRGTFPTESDVGAKFTMWSGTARGCYVPRRRAVAFSLCGGVSGGLVRAEGFGGARNRIARSGWAAAVLAPTFVWLPHPRVGVGSSMDAFVALLRPSFSGEDRPVFHTAAPVAVQALGFVEFRWGS